jgi:hypothetical protein
MPRHSAQSYQGSHLIGASESRHRTRRNFDSRGGTRSEKGRVFFISAQVRAGGPGVQMRDGRGLRWMFWQ